MEESFVGEKWPGPRIPTVLSLWLGLPGKSTASDQTLQWILKALWLRLPANYTLWGRVTPDGRSEWHTSVVAKVQALCRSPSLYITA